MNNTDNTPADTHVDPIAILFTVIVLAISSPVIVAAIYSFLHSKP